MLANQLNICTPISLAEMNDASLMKRTDTKFLVPSHLLPSIVAQLQHDYRILQIGPDRLMTYNSTYYDTPENHFYHTHHNGRAHRIKVRIRNYVESDLSFLEVKQKDSYGNTVKKRIKVTKVPTKLEGKQHQFVTETTHQDFMLEQSITNAFSRFTLVQNSLKERVTFDTKLAFNESAFNDDLAIVELKQARLDRDSLVYSTLKNMGIHPYSISKYCIGMAHTFPLIKQNFFKSKFLRINKLTK